MDKGSMDALLSRLPLLIRMNDGREYVVRTDRDILNTEISSYVLYRSDNDANLRGIHLPYVTMAGVEELAGSF